MKHITYNILKSVSVILLSVTCYMLHVTYISAQQVTLSISPPIVEMLVKPGKTLLVAYTIQNLADPAALEVKVRPFSPQGDFGEMIIDDELLSPIRFSLDNTNIQFEKPFFMRQRDMTQALVRIRIPEGTPEGDYYFTVLAETQPVPEIGGSSTSLAQATIGSTLLLTVTNSGILEAKGRIALFEMKPNFVFRFFGQEYKIVESGNKTPVSLIIQNLGKNLIKPQGEIVIRGPLGQKKSYGLLPQNILAQSQRLIKTSEGNNMSQTDSLLLSDYFIGPYSLSTNVNFGEGSAQFFATTTFIGIPYKGGAAIIAVSLISIIIVSIMKKKREV